MPDIWSTARLSDGKKAAPFGGTDTSKGDLRSAFERDYDRMLFSTPVRRLSDKTQVFPLDRNDGVRTRLTHSHEVSNLARSIGRRLLKIDPQIFGAPEIAAEVPTILAVAGLGHDLGNPPFGHQGEAAIRDWFSAAATGPEQIFGSVEAPLVSTELQKDFTNFEGNAHTLRLVARLQVHPLGCGLDLTACSLAALMKYTVPSHRSGQSDSASRKKPGYFASEADVVKWVRAKTGLSEGQRHPLTWLMEACDDIAYSVLDVEDAIKKRIVSADDVFGYLSAHSEVKDTDIILQLKDDFLKAGDGIRPSRSAEIKTTYLRTRLIGTLVTGAADEFVKNKKAIFDYTQTKPLLSIPNPTTALCRALKKFAASNAYSHSSVLKIEAVASKTMHKLMDYFWKAVCNREDQNDRSSKRKEAMASFVYSIVSDNYKSEFEDSEISYETTMRYRELQLISDMAAGMTDSFAMNLCNEFEEMNCA